jgi:hypothetical protein
LNRVKREQRILKYFADVIRENIFCVLKHKLVNLFFQTDPYVFSVLFLEVVEPREAVVGSLLRFHDVNVVQLLNAVQVFCFVRLKSYQVYHDVLELFEKKPKLPHIIESFVFVVVKCVIFSEINVLYHLNCREINNHGFVTLAVKIFCLNNFFVRI